MYKYINIHAVKVIPSPEGPLHSNPNLLILSDGSNISTLLIKSVKEFIDKAEVDTSIFNT
jgi:hypothetical protein